MKPPRRDWRPVLIAILVAALLVEYREGPHIDGLLTAALAPLAGLSGVFACAVQRIWVRRVLAGVGGAAAALLFFQAAPLAWSVVTLVILVALLRRRLDCALLFAAVSLAGAMASSSAIAGLHAVSLFGFAFLGLKALVVALLLEGSGDHRAPAALGSALLLFTFALVLLRVMNVASALAIPVENSWAESPFLTDMLKLDAHQPVYGALDQMNTNSYAPTLVILHHAVLAPFHAELSLVANRALTVVDLLIASGIFAWAVAPHTEGLTRLLPSRSGMWGVGVAFLVCSSSLLAGSVHPDHPSLVGLAVALALVVREGSWPRWLFWTTLLLVTPLTVAFKLTGAGIGLGLAAVMLVERRVRECLVLVASGALSLATIPLFDATSGPFSADTMGVQRTHPMQWQHLRWPPTLHFVAAAAVAITLTALFMRGESQTEARRALRRIALLFAGVVALMLPAYVKYAGRENNLLPILAFCVLAVVVAATRSAGRLHPLLGPAMAVYLIMLVWVPSQPETVPDVPILTQMAAVEGAMNDDDRAGERTLVASTALWIRHGRRDVPPDRLTTAYELFFGHHPEAELFFQHVEDGRYRSIVIYVTDIKDPAVPAFAERLKASLSARYTRIYPPPDQPLETVVYVIYRRDAVSAL